MTIEEILEQLKYNEDRIFPREALTEAIEKREELIPELLEILKYSTDNIETLSEESNYFAHIYAMFLLAQFREKRAYKLLVNLFSTPGEIISDFTGDILTEDLHRILSSVCDGDISLIKTLIEDESVNEYARSSALKALTLLVAIGEKSREEIMNYIKELFNGKIERKFSHIWNALVTQSTNLYPEEVYEDIKKAYEDDLVETFFISFKDVENALEKGKARTLSELKNNNRFSLVNDTITDIEWWGCFKQPKEKKKINRLRKPIVSKQKKIGRNQPCPCGSGKKYKKCCLK